MKPAAGITSVTSKTQGALGALQNTTVEFVVHNKHDFENIFLPFFLKPGSIVCIDYGWSDSSFSLYNPLDQIKDKPLDMSTFDFRTMIGCSIPLSLIEFVNSSKVFSSNIFLG